MMTMATRMASSSSSGRVVLQRLLRRRQQQQQQQWLQQRVQQQRQPPRMHNTTNHNNPRCFSSRSGRSGRSSSRPNPTNPAGILGAGGHQWNQMDRHGYAEVLAAALRRGIAAVEVGQPSSRTPPPASQEGGGQAAGGVPARTSGEEQFCDAVRAILERDPAAFYDDEGGSEPKQLDVLFRIGYRTIYPPILPGDDENGNAAVPDIRNRNVPESMPNDVVVDEQSFQKDWRLSGETAPVSDVDGNPTSTIRTVHNIGKEYVRYTIQNSPLVTLQHELYDKYPIRLNLIPLLHNPEEQVHHGGTGIGSQAANDMSLAERQYYIQRRMVESFETLEEFCDPTNHHRIDRYGVVSNGLCLPVDHPLHLSYETVLRASDRGPNCSVVQLPYNALETGGARVARRIKQYSSLRQKQKKDDENENQEDPTTTTTEQVGTEEEETTVVGRTEEKETKQQLQVYAMRPLTCYPDLGTGTGFPFVLADYLLPATMEKSLQWSNTMTHPPEAYEVALKTAMQHFDAEELIQMKVEGQELTPEQRETLDGCKLLQSLLHDLDRDLGNVRSYAAHEQELYERIIPLIHDTFEAYDDETAHVLQTFFGAYSLGVRYSIAKNTRKLLKEGEKGSNIHKFDIPDDERLQEFGLRHVLTAKVSKEENDKENSGGGDLLFDKVMVGFSQAEHVIDTMEITQKILSSMSKK